MPTENYLASFATRQIESLFEWACVPDPYLIPQ
jgi:hypothetical protein